MTTGDAAPARSTKVLLADDHPLLAHGVATVLRAEGFEVEVVQGCSPESILAAARQSEPDVVLLDLVLGDDYGDSIGLVAPLRSTGARVLMLTGVTDPALLGACLEAGADGVVAKGGSYDELVERVLAAARGDRQPFDRHRDALLRSLRRRRSEDRARLAPFERLTPAERRVLAALMAGRSAEQIAGDTTVSITTVRSHIRSLLAKLGVHSQTAAVALAHRAGWRGDPAAAPGAPTT